jgi:DNA mismatch repair protein MutL
VAPTIHILSADVANKIAAGEVIQRPASAVKELVENALDAGAKHVTVLVKDAGKTLLHVIDDGGGMSAEDAELAFRRHATSKIKTPNDLEAIKTLGFRGEALASIAAVAQVELKTRTGSEDVGTLIRVEGSEVRERSKTAQEAGTSVLVRNLFYNTPARRSFLKTDHTELKNITDTITRMALAYPEVGWHYVSDDETLLDLKPSTLEGRLRDVFGNRQVQSMVKLHEDTDYIRIDGYIGKPDFSRKSRSDQYLYINRRMVLNRTINHAVFQAYEHLLVKGAFPFFVLNLTLDPRKVDVNVHPSKMEVKFENDSNIYRFVLSVVRKTLSANDLVPSVAFSREEGLADPGQRIRLDAGLHRPTPAPGQGQPSGASWWSAPVVSSMDQDVVTAPADVEKLFAKIEHRMSGSEPSAPTQQAVQFSHRERVLPHESVRPLAEGDPVRELRAIWQLHNKYILSQIRNGLLIVDQHVAHERILYERALANFERDLPSSQQLLFPHTIQFGADDYTLVRELQPHLQRLGFDLKLFGKNTVVIEGIPADVRVGNESVILQDVLNEYKNNEHGDSMDARDNVAKSFACKAAIKAGDKLTTTEMIVLIDQLFATTMPYVCPHGRPVVVKIPIEELDRRFGRT